MKIAHIALNKKKERKIKSKIINCKIPSNGSLSLQCGN